MHIQIARVCVNSAHESFKSPFCLSREFSVALDTSKAHTTTARDVHIYIVHCIVTKLTDTRKLRRVIKKKTLAMGESIYDVCLFTFAKPASLCFILLCARPLHPFDDLYTEMCIPIH